MSGPSSESPSTFSQTYKEIVIILNNGNHMLMQKCLSCGFMVRNNGFAKLSHWYPKIKLKFYDFLNLTCFVFISGNDVRQKRNLDMYDKMIALDIFLYAHSAAGK